MEINLASTIRRLTEPNVKNMVKPLLRGRGNFVSERPVHIHITQYFHTVCAFESFKRARVAVNVISSTDNLNGMDLITDDEKLAIKKVIESYC